ncbi:MAG: DUF3696 domain-containing protein [Phycisphaerae bacterium]
MPLTEIRLHNFKCFADSGPIPVAPLTVIFGRNNTGKSSILQSLLLLRQSLDSPEFGPRLSLRGPLYPAGGYADIVHQHRSKQHLMMEFGVEVGDRGWHATVELEFCSDEPQPPRLTRLRVSRRGGSTSDAEPLEIRRGRGAGGPYELVIGKDSLGGEKRANFLFPVNRFLPVIGPELPRVGRPSSRRGFTRHYSNAILQELERILRQLRAVGAFRRQPDRRYEFQGRAPETVDAAGENVVNALIEDATRRRHRGELLHSVNQWLKAVGRVRLMPLRRISRTARIFEVRLRDTDSGRWANFADVGFGVGQAFPVFVEGLRTPQEGTFLVQEPEIHLHPDAQLAMGDFLVDLARSGKRVIAETHSEHLLLRIRHLIVGKGNGRQSRFHLRPEDVSIVYVEKRPDGTSHGKHLALDDLGQIKNWPADFMEEATRERMAIMRAMARRVEGTE